MNLLIHVSMKEISNMNSNSYLLRCLWIHKSPVKNVCLFCMCFLEIKSNHFVEKLDNSIRNVMNVKNCFVKNDEAPYENFEIKYKMFLFISCEP
jgi:hypothetical protein